jgi:hypothetical protein
MVLPDAAALPVLHWGEPQKVVDAAGRLDLAPGDASFLAQKDGLRARADLPQAPPGE